MRAPVRSGCLPSRLFCRLSQLGLETAEAPVAKGEGRCVDFDQAPRYLRREFILSGYYVGEPSECPVPAP